MGAFEGRCQGDSQLGGNGGILFRRGRGFLRRQERREAAVTQVKRDGKGPREWAMKEAACDSRDSKEALQDRRGHAS